MKKQIERTKTNLDFERNWEIRSFQSKGKNNFVSWEISKAKQTKQEGRNLFAANIHVLYETQAIQVRTRTELILTDQFSKYPDGYLQARKFKRTRAQGECLGIRSRWRTWQAAISRGELQISFDPRISEWGNSHGEEPWNVTWIHSVTWGTPRSETSK